MTSARNHLSKAEAALVAQMKDALPALALARTFVQRFTDMLRNGTADALPGWFKDAATSDVASFARGLQSDQPAVAAALTDPWSDGLRFPRDDGHPFQLIVGSDSTR